MLITPDEIIQYSVFEAVKNRPPELLRRDILEAEADIQQMTGHRFTDEKYYPLPEKARLALLQLAQYYALKNGDESLLKGYKSEKLGDYSYTLSDGGGIVKPDVYKLLEEYILDYESARLKVRAI
ncbi:DUF3199 family protein [Bacillus swezeyi]|uniref:DUF3199 family protein n=1 Tax=Bacillus swezeyi TaxID=1925020 RepID=A0A1R1Q8K9_9BACI|nr:DUF3199 family protein [Bacillus swezeyi]MEC1262511.1 DUF3199 family protein [Bacillus swezeyi]MED2926780.1 DUF3199 family protein [Bacillus swezeyi]MED2965658.1 DUF3199 family protein [Bacillus swezeyi]MED2978348.1 DUF3199 family protein [Bacillus swezeyi]MED3070939.1 DUF3199 family protein [Bacillus swezeyi]